MQMSKINPIPVSEFCHTIACILSNHYSYSVSKKYILVIHHIKINYPGCAVHVKIRIFFSKKIVCLVQTTILYAWYDEVNCNNSTQVLMISLQSIKPGQ